MDRRQTDSRTATAHTVLACNASQGKNNHSHTSVAQNQNITCTNSRNKHRKFIPLNNCYNDKNTSYRIGELH